MPDSNCIRWLCARSREDGGGGSGGKRRCVQDLQRRILTGIFLFIRALVLVLLLREGAGFSEGRVLEDGECESSGAVFGGGVGVSEWNVYIC